MCISTENNIRIFYNLLRSFNRFLPCCIEALNGAGVVKLAAGTFHSLAQTACSQVKKIFFYFLFLLLKDTEASKYSILFILFVPLN